MTVAFALSDVSLTVAQAATVALPGAPRLRRLRALHSRLWALVPPLLIVGFVALVRALPGTASLFSYAAFAGLPPLAGFGLAFGMRRRRPPAAALVAPLLVLAWVAPQGLAGQAATLALMVLAAVALAVLLVQLVPVRWLMIGMLAMALSDAALLTTGVLQPANHLLLLGAPGSGLPQLQVTVLGAASCGFGDFFIAALFGALLASAQRSQRRAALITFALALAFDAAFLVVDNLPATVPVAAAMLVVELERRLRARRKSAQPPSTLLPLSKFTRVAGAAAETVPANSPFGVCPVESTARALP